MFTRNTKTVCACIQMFQDPQFSYVIVALGTSENATQYLFSLIYI